MKRLTTLIIAFVFVVCTVFTVPVSFADKNKDSSVTDSDKENTKVVDKDTSWFDSDNPKDEYRITSEAQLIGLASLVNEEQTDKWKPTRVESFEGVTFKLSRDIKLTQPWTPIGSDSSVNFAGTFDGNGHTISNIEITTSFGHSGFFGYLSGEVKDLNLEGVNKTSDSNCGGLVGTLAETGKVTNCKVNMKVSGNDKTGGIVGSNTGGHIEGCVNLGNVSGTYKVGGVVGENWGGTVTKCGNSGKVKSTRRGVGTYGTGGVAGRSVSATAELNECYNTGKISSNTEATGGVVGYINAKGSAVRDCYSTGTINLNLKSSGKELSESYAGGVVGIAGVNGVVIRNCYNAGMINGADFSGGVIGYYINDTDVDIDEQYIRNNYYISSAKSGIGLMDDEEDPNLDRATKSVSAGSMHNLTASLSVDYMKDTGVYGNNGYPVLSWQEPINEVEKEYFDGMPEDIQRELDEYLIKTAGETAYGHMLLNTFSPDNLTTDAFIVYNEAKDKIENLKKDEELKNEQ